MKMVVLQLDDLDLFDVTLFTVVDALLHVYFEVTVVD